jgi:hypothetical protein
MEYFAITTGQSRAFGASVAKPGLCLLKDYP